MGRPEASIQKPPSRTTRPTRCQVPAGAASTSRQAPTTSDREPVARNGVMVKASRFPPDPSGASAVEVRLSGVDTKSGPAATPEAARCMVTASRAAASTPDTRIFPWNPAFAASVAKPSR